MNTRYSIGNLFAARSTRTPRKASQRRRLSLEGLEDRKLLSTFTVTSTLDNGAAGTLRYEIGLANAAGGNETIAFDSQVFKTPQVITLGGTQLELSDTTGTETITGPAGGVTVSGGGASRVFQVDNLVTASISGLTITGGNAGYDYGGGLLNLGTTSLTNCTVSGNSSNCSGSRLHDTQSGVAKPAEDVLGCDLS